MSASAVQPRIVLGDARLSLEKRTGSRFDLMMFDAFSSDAIPAHLLTREAFQVYLANLADNGVIAFHISNKYLDLEHAEDNLGRVRTALHLSSVRR